MFVEFEFVTFWKYIESDRSKATVEVINTK